MEGNQRERLLDLLKEFCNKQQSRTFSLKDLNERYDDFRTIGVGGNTPQNTVRRLLQEIRDDGLLTFKPSGKVGNYTLLFDELLEYEPQHINASALRGKPHKREYLIETSDRNRKLVVEAKDTFGTQCMIPKCDNNFVTQREEDYIEVHHVIPLHLEGQDRLENLSVLCAHHHRMAHFSRMQTQDCIRDFLLETVATRLQSQR